MAKSVSGKVAFVTGGASGIGAALVAKLIDGGAEVWIADRQLGQAQELAQRLSGGGGKVHALDLDVRDYSAFERAVAEGVGALPGGDPDPDSHGGQIRAKQGRQRRTNDQVPGGVSADGARGVRRACTAGRIAWRRDHRGADLVEGIVVLESTVTCVGDPSRKALAQADA
jgi:NAD(P)-dependent dehydrogenase (short-subunit alcohol dehydrogenase family)